jgi:hypothetical protein
MKLLIGLSLAVLVLCILSALVSYQRGYNSGLRVQQREALNVPGLVDVYGCGVDRFVRIDPKRGVTLHEVLASLQPLPSAINEVFFHTNHSAGTAQSATLSEALGTNGIGSWQLRGGESILLVHRFK